MSSRLLSAVREAVGDESIVAVVRLAYRSWWRFGLRWCSPLAILYGIVADVPLAIWGGLVVQAAGWWYTRELVVGLRADSAVVFDRRSHSQSVGPDFYDIDRSAIERSSDREGALFRPAPWRVLDREVVAHSDADAVLRDWVGPPVEHG